MKVLSLFMLIGCLPICANAQTISIAEARSTALQTEVTISGVATHGPELGIIRYIQDGTAGIAAYGAITETVLRGDSVTITGILKDYNGLLELDPISNLVNHGAAINLVEAEEFSLGNIGESTEGKLVSLSNIVFQDGGGTFSANTEYTITNAGQDGNIYVRTGHPLVGELIPVGTVNLTAISSQFTFTGFGGYQLLPRDADDISSPNPINIISAISVADQTVDGFTLSWDTDLESTTGAYYTDLFDAEGITDNVLDIGGSTVAHSISLSGLEQGDVYYVQIYSVLGADTAFSNIEALATVSQAPGEVNAYFNGSVATQYATPGNEAITTHLRDTIIAYIDRAQSTLDLAIYNINNPTIAAAINAAYDRGVQVRYIAEGQNANIALGSFDSGIPLLLRQNSDGSGMHNKFVVVDYASADSAFVLTGSTNFTNNNLSGDFNNLVVVRDRALAKAYTIEFDEMWGSHGAAPLAANAKFGDQKINNTPKQFIINGDKVELYFSPSDGTTSALAEALETVGSSLEFALLLLTQNQLADIILAKSNIFTIEVSGLINDINTGGSDFDYLVENFVDVSVFDQSNVLHHKYAVIDQNAPSSDPMVITGSHNWTASAGEVNDENTLIIHNAALANQYYQEYKARRDGVLSAINEGQASQAILVVPNPARESVSIIYNAHSNAAATLTLTSITGSVILNRSVFSVAGLNQIKVDLTGIESGIYITTVASEKGSFSSKLVISAR